MSNVFNNLIFTLNITLPILLILALGIWLKQKNIIDEHFTSIGNRLIFNVALPSLLFIKISVAPIVEQFDINFLGIACLINIGVVVFFRIGLSYFIKDGVKTSVIVQSMYRGNMGIVGLALIFNMYAQSPAALAQAAVYLGFMTLIYNFMAIFLLQPKGKILSLKTIKQIILNPLIIAITLACIWSVLHLPLNEIVKQTGQYFANLTLPLALLCIGGSLQWHSLSSNKNWVIISAFVKLIVIPFIAVLIGLYFEFSQVQIGLLFLFMCTPTAAASYVMAKQLTPYGAIAAETIVISTLFSSVTITLGLFLLKTFNLI